jgi:hypothetical protein
MYRSVVERLDGGFSEDKCGSSQCAAGDPSVMLQSRNPSLRSVAVRG